jgi:hypothetical protein
MRNMPPDDCNLIEFWNKKTKEFSEVQVLADEFDGKQTAVEIAYLDKSKGQPECWFLLGGGPVVRLRLVRLINECLQKLGESVADEPWEAWTRILASDSAVHLILPISANGKIGPRYAEGAFERYIREHSFKVIADSVLFCRLQAEDRANQGAVDSNVTNPARDPALTPLAGATGIAAVPNINQPQVYDSLPSATDASGTLSHSLGSAVEAALRTKERKRPHGREGRQVKSLRRYRLEAKLSQRTLAERVLLSVEQISHLECGRRNASQQRLEDLRDALNKDLSKPISISDLCAEPT